MDTLPSACLLIPYSGAWVGANGNIQGMHSRGKEAGPCEPPPARPHGTRQIMVMSHGERYGSSAEAGLGGLSS